MTRRSAVLFAGLGIAWGIPYLLIAVAVTELAPSVLVLARTAGGALLLLPLALARGQVRPVLRRWRPLVAYTAAEVLVPWLLLGRAERTVASSTTALVVAAVPLVGVLVGWGARAARLRGATAPPPLGRRGFLGLALGTAGVAALVGASVVTAGAAPGALGELGLVVLGYAVGAWVLGAQLADLPGTGVVATSLALSAVVYAPVVLLGPGLPALPSAPVVVSVVVLAAVCTAAAFLLLFALVAELGAVRATTVVYVNPLVAVAAGALVLGEAVTVWTVLGAALVLGGSVLASSRPAARRPEPVQRAPA